MTRKSRDHLQCDHIQHHMAETNGGRGIVHRTMQRLYLGCISVVGALTSFAHSSILVI
jgi:hypothetical protein